MDNTNHSEPNNNHEGIKISSPLGLLFLLPVFIIVIIYMIIPLFGTLITSFTTYYSVQGQAFAGFENFLKLWYDDILRISLLNTIVFTFFSVIIATGLSFLIAWGSSSLGRGFKTLLCILFSILSASYILPDSLVMFLSSFVYDHLNAYLLKIGKNILYVPFFHGLQFNRIVSILLPVLIGLGPLYVLFTLAFQNREKLRFFSHLAVSLQIVISMLSFLPTMKLVGFPSIKYSGHTLPMHILDYMTVRLAGGYGSALIITLGILIFILAAIFNFIVSIVCNAVKQVKSQSHEINDVSEHNQELPVFIFILAILLFSVFILPFTQTLFETFKPIQELYMFPKKLLPMRPTLKNYMDNINNLPFGKPITNSGVLFLVSTMIMFIVSILSGIGFSLYRYRGRRVLLHGLTFSLVLSPVLLLSPVSLNYARNFSLGCLLFQSPAFGLTLYFSTMVIDSCTKGLSDIRDFIGSGQRIVSAGLKLLAISVLASLASWFSMAYVPYNSPKSTLVSLAPQPMSIMSNSILQVLTMILPIAIILISIPVISNIVYRTKE